MIFTGYFGGYSQMNAALRGIETEVGPRDRAPAGASGRPLLAQAMFWDSAPARALREGGVPVYRDIEASSTRSSELVEGRDERTPRRGGGGRGGAADRRDRATSNRGSSLPTAGSPCSARGAAPVDEARAAAAGLGLPGGPQGARTAPQVDAGGVALGLADDAAVAAAAADMHERLAPMGYSVETMAPTEGGVELIVGARRDRALGRWSRRDRRHLRGAAAGCARGTAPAPVDELEELLLSLRGAGVLTGARAGAVDLRAAAEAAAALCASRPPIPRLRKSRSTRCSSPRRGRSASTRASCYDSGGKAPRQGRNGGGVTVSYRVATVDELQDIAYREDTHMRPVRRRLGITAFGSNAWTAANVGDRLDARARGG